MSAPRLNNTQPVTEKGDPPSLELLKLMAEIARKIDSIDARVTALETP